MSWIHLLPLGTDVELAMSNLLVSPTNADLTVGTNISIVDDINVEDIERYSIFLTSSDANVDVVTPQSTLVIRDNDCK